MKQRNPNGFRLRRAWMLSAVLFLLILVSCKKDGILTPAFNTSHFELRDTVLPLSTSTIKGDTLLAYDAQSGKPFSNAVLGVLHDEVYGTYKASFFTRMYMSTSFIDPPNAIDVVDSMVLYLAWKESYGFSTDLNVKVYEVTETFDPEKTYYTNHEMDHDSTPLGIGVLSLNPADSIPDSANTIRIRLNDELCQRVSDKQRFADMNEWLDFFKGLWITADLPNAPDQSGAMAYVLPANPFFKMILHYHDSKGGNYEYAFYGTAGTDVYGRYFSKFDIEPSDFILTQEKLGNGVEYNYLATMAGPRTLIHINHMELLTDLRPLNINKAELIVPFEDRTTLEYFYPENLGVAMLGEDGSLQNLIEQDRRYGDSYMGGVLDETKKEFRFNLASSLSDVINKGHTDLRIALNTRASSVTANRIRINSGIHPTRPMYILMTYTKPL